MNIPYRFLEQVIRELREKGYVDSRRGINGGYFLAAEPSEINLLDVVESLHGPIELVPCMEHPGDCKLTAICPASDVWKKVDQGIREALGGVTLDKLKHKGPAKRTQAAAKQLAKKFFDT